MSNIDNSGIYTMIDAGSILFINAYRFKDSDDVDEVLKGLDEYIRTLLDNTAATYYAGFIDGSKCFRHDISVTKKYKSNRPPSPDWFVKWSGPMKAYLRDEWNFQIVNGIEADDAVCIYQTWCLENNKNSIMCHGDKDLYQIEGNHYDIRKHTRKYVDAITAQKNLYKQILTGDASDAIVGLYGCGKVSAAKVIDHCERWEDMATNCLTAFQEKLGDFKGAETYTEMYTLCKLLTHSNELPIVWNTYEPKVLTVEPEIDLTGLIWD